MLFIPETTFELFLIRRYIELHAQGLMVSTSNPLFDTTIIIGFK